MKTADRARVYRFDNSVAFYTEGMTETVYLTPKMAMEFAEAIEACIFDISCLKFTDSTLGSIEIEDPPLVCDKCGATNACFCDDEDK